jgi:hypothetical protein
LSYFLIGIAVFSSITMALLSKFRPKVLENLKGIYSEHRTKIKGE